MYKFLFAIAFLFVLNSQADDGIYLIRIDVKNAKSGDFGQDVGPKIAALEIKSVKDCIDFMNTGTSASGSIFSGGFSLLSHSAPQPADVKAIKAAICGSEPNCLVNVSSSYFENSELKVGSYGESEGLSKGPVTLGVISKKIPRFSHACEDGKSYWTDAANTQESREFLKGIGLNVEKTRTLELLQGEEGVFSFGFPKHQKAEIAKEKAPTAAAAPAARPEHNENHDSPPPAQQNDDNE